MWRRVVIDLTSLLDVILILMFLILASASQQAEAVREESKAVQEEYAEANAHIAQLEAELSEAEQRSNALSRQLEGFTFVNEHCTVINVCLESGSVDRVARIESPDGDKTFPLSWSNAQAVRTAMTAEFARCLSNAEENEIFFIFFRYERSSVYQSDYRLISGIINQVKTAYPGVYYAEYETLKEDE